MTHGDEGPGFGAQRALEPQDALEVQVVGGLVEQQDLGLQRELASECQALAPAAGQGLRRQIRALEARPAESQGDPVETLVLGQPLQSGDGLGHDLLRGPSGREDGVLGHEPHPGPPAQGHPAGVRLDPARQDCEQGRLAGPVGADQADGVALVEDEAEPLEERAGAEGVGQAFGGEEDGRRHGPRKPSLPF